MTEFQDRRREREREQECKKERARVQEGEGEDGSHEPDLHGTIKQGTSEMFILFCSTLKALGRHEFRE